MKTHSHLTKKKDWNSTCSIVPTFLVYALMLLFANEYAKLLFFYYLSLIDFFFLWHIIQVLLLPNAKAHFP